MQNKNKKSTSAGFTRRDFIKGSGLTAAGFFIVPRHVLGGNGFKAPSDTLNIAGIGVGGKGTSNLIAASKFDKETGKTVENIVALCDVDDVRAKESFENYPKAKRYRDFREMLEKQKDIDAVMVSTPDNTHAVAAMACMQLGKHVYVEKPLTHDVYEARMLTEAARKYKVATQMGNQGNSSDDIRLITEWIDAGVIGEVKEVDAWTNRPIWPQGVPLPTGKFDIPDTLSWDLWVGPAPYRDYHPEYLPFKWRGWWTFGTGALGDMACHIIDPVFMALRLGYPDTVQASAGKRYTAESGWSSVPLGDSCPPSSKLAFTFPSRGNMPPVKLHWHDGGIRPDRPLELEDDQAMGDPGGGVIFHGTKGKLMCDVYARNPRLIPVMKMENFSPPAPTIHRIQESHQYSWVEACKGGRPASSNFDYAGPLTETILMGNLALRSLELEGGADNILEWDGENMRITNYEPANQFVKRDYREGWSL